MKARLGLAFFAGTLACSSLASLAQAQETGNRPPPIRILRAPAAPVAATPTAAAAQADAGAINTTQITPPAAINARVLMPNSVTLRNGPDMATIQSLNIIRQLPLADVRAAKVLTLGTSRFNMAPVLNNPRSLFNIAARMRAQPQLTEVLADDTRVFEVDKGLIIHSFINYRVKQGSCTDNARRVMITRGGISCATYLTPEARAAAFANKRDAHYVADPVARARAIAEAAEKSAIVDAELNKYVAQIRAQLANPATRAQFDADGAGEADRLAALDDNALKSEIVNSGETSVEQTLFVPRVDRVDANFTGKYPIRNKAAGLTTISPGLMGGMTVNPSIIPMKIVTPDTDSTQPLSDYTFLTGFTLGKDYEWKERIEKSIKLCLVGCKKTYFVEVFAGFNYGFGLRFPIKMNGTYTYHRSGEKPSDETATVTTNFVPINGSVDDYANSGLEAGKLFEGKELVAQVGAHAGAAYNLPFIPSMRLDIPVGFDFTKELTGDFYDGQFTPPAPGGGNNPKMEKIFDNFDLIGGRANFGVLGAQIFPAIKVDLTSDKLTFNLHDSVKNTDTLLTNSGQQVSLGIDNNHTSRFSISDPKYNVALNVTPGIDARLFVDISVWSHTWDFPVWFPQLAIQLPPGGADFGCHEGTKCTRSYVYSPKGRSESSDAGGPFDGDMEGWGNAFTNQHLSECADETCRIGIRFIRQGYIYGARHKRDADPTLTSKSPAIINYLAGAKGEARTVINESQARQTANAANDFGVLWTAWWSKQCADKICLDKIKPIVALEKLEVNAYQKQHPDASTNEAIGTVGKKFAPIFEAEVKASKDRVAAEEAAQAARKAKLGKPAFTPIRIGTPMQRTN